MENYKEKYEQGLECIQEILSGAGDSIKTSILRKRLQPFFSELKESEDEKIRKEIIDFLELPHHQFVGKRNHEKWISWLENQCKKQGKSALEVWKDMRLEVYQQASGNRHEPNYSDDSTKMFSLNDIDEIIEKISEQSHDDKIKPKFHEGDWIISNNKKSIYQVIEVKRGIYVIRDNADNHEYYIDIEECEKSGRLWTINDAKDGDVLAGDSCIFIMQKLSDNNTAKTYCILYNDGDFNYDAILYLHFYIDSTKPATKEQRDLLFCKMHNAGYEWDAEKKKLNSLLDSFPVKPLKEK